MSKSKRERFLDVAKKRTQKVLDALAQLERIADRRSYEYTPEEADQILGAIADRTARLERALREEPGFSFE